MKEKSSAPRTVTGSCAKSRVSSDDKGINLGQFRGEVCEKVTELKDE